MKKFTFLMLGLLIALFSANAKVVNLSEMTADYEAQDKDTLTGVIVWTSNPLKLTVAKNATITLDNATIYGKDNDIYPWAGITCLGNAKIYLKGKNYVKGNRWGYPGIYWPYSSDLEIYEAEEGAELTAEAYVYAAGLGAGYLGKDQYLHSGNLYVHGGKIIANGSYKAAGIGGAYKAGCGDIKIFGGIIIAKGGDNSAAIGGGEEGDNGSIWIDEKITAITAIKGSGAPCSVGKGLNGNSYVVSVLGVDYGNAGMVSDLEWDPRKVYTEYVAADGTLTYYFDDQMAKRTGTTEEYDPETVRFKAYNQLVKKVVIDVSMKKAELTTMKRLFYGYRDTGDSYSLENATAIEGLANLNTAAVTSMEQMFYGMDKIDTIDLSSFNTSNVTSMREMFGLCYALKSLNLTSFNTANVLSMRAMFQGCLALPALDITSFSVDKVTSMVNMFYDCEALKSIYCDGNWSTSTASSDAMFYGCTQLEGGRGTKYNSSKDDNEYARPDKGSQAGYFTSVIEIIDGEKGVITWDKETLTTIRTYVNNSMGSGGQPLVKYIDDAMPAIDAALANTGTTYAVAQAIEAARKTADGVVTGAQNQYIALIVEDIKAKIDANAEPDDSDACKKIIADGKAEADQLAWNGAETVKENLDLLFDNDIASKTINALIGQRIVEKKVVLKAIIDEMVVLKEKANEFLEDKTMLTPLQDAIDAANQTYNRSDATYDMVTTAITAAETAFKTAIEAFMNKAKEEICKSFDDMLKTGDSKACEQLVADAKAAINAIEWDSSKSVNENYMNIYGTGYSVTKKLSEDLEAQREEDNKAPVCDFTTKATSHGKYSDSWVYDGKWTVFGGSNNNGNWNYVKMGGNKDNIATANPVYVANKDAFTKEIKGIKVSYPEGSFPTASKMGVNEWGVKVYKTPECKEADLLYTVKGDAAAITNKAATLILRPEAGQTWAAGCGFQVYWDIINTSTTNGTVFVETIEFSYEDIPLGIDNVQSDNVQNAKILRNGQLFILRDGKMYTTSGAEVR